MVKGMQGVAHADCKLQALLRQRERANGFSCDLAPIRRSQVQLLRLSLPEGNSRSPCNLLLLNVLV